MHAILDEDLRRRHRLRNLLHSVVLVTGLGLLMSVLAWVLLGLEGVIWAVAAAALALTLGPRISPELVMRLYRAQPVGPAQAGALFTIVDRLSARAELPARPALYVVPSSTLNAFAVGESGNASIAVTVGLLNRLSLREAAGVLAHEISHIRNNDLWIMGLADTLSRVTQIMSYFGIFLLILNLPSLLTGAAVVPWTVVALLYFAPTVGSLLQLALSRAREYDADLEAAMLTGDPVGLASALKKLERYEGRFWEDMLFPGRRIPQPSLLRTHPPTEERIRRLLELRRPHGPAIPIPVQHSEALVAGLAPPAQRTRYHLPGVWY